MNRQGSPGFFLQNTSWQSVLPTYGKLAVLPYANMSSLQKVFCHFTFIYIYSFEEEKILIPENS